MPAGFVGLAELLIKYWNENVFVIFYVNSKHVEQTITTKLYEKFNELNDFERMHKKLVLFGWIIDHRYGKR